MVSPPGTPGCRTGDTPPDRSRYQQPQSCPNGYRSRLERVLDTRSRMALCCGGPQRKDLPWLSGDKPAVFIHGLWLHATSWSPWLDLFREAGYEPIAPGWPNEPPTVAEAREHPELVANIGIDDVTAHMAQIIDGLDAAPMIVGHSFGGLIAEKLLGEGYGAAAVAIDPAQIKGVLPLPLAQLRAGLPALGNPANLHKAVSLTSKEFRFGFGNALSEEESDTLFERWTIPSPARPLFEAAVANFALHSPAKVDTKNEGARTSAAHLGHGGSHGAGQGHPFDPEAVPRLQCRHRAQAIRGTGSLPDDRRGLEGRGRTPSSTGSRPMSV